MYSLYYILTNQPYSDYWESIIYARSEEEAKEVLQPYLFEGESITKITEMFDTPDIIYHSSVKY